jgi:hypothetical protein
MSDDLNRMRKLAGILTESVMAVPGVGSESDMQTAGNAARGSNYAAFDAAQPNIDETAPPGMEDMVMKLKKQYPGHEEKAFATAWSIYNKKHGSTEESTMMEANPLDPDIQSAIEMFQDLEHNGYGPEEIVSTIEQSFRDDGFVDSDIASIMSAIQQHISSDDSEEDHDDTCSTCDGTGIGQYGDPDTSRCSSCGGSGVARGEYDNDDYEPDEYDPDDNYMGPLEEAMPIDQSKLDDALDSLIRVMNSGAEDAEGESAWIAKTHNVPPEALAHAYAQYKAQEIGRSGMMEEVEEEIDEAFDLNNGYDDIQFMAAGDFFPDGADSPVVSSTGASGARQGDNDEQKKMAVAETHKELVYNYRKFLKESAKK